MSDQETARVFTEFAREVEPRLRQSLIAALGPETGREAAADALAWAWEHWPRVEALDNPAGYLYRLGRNRGSSSLRRRRAFTQPEEGVTGDDPWVEPGLTDALARLSEMQRVTVLLVHGFGWSQREVAEHFHLAAGTVQVHVERGMAKLRHDLKVELNA